MRCLLEPGHEEAGEADRGEVGDIAHHFLIFAQWNLKLIPLHLGVCAVACGGYRHLLVGDEVLAHHEVFGADGYAVLEVALVFVEGIVLIDILYIGHRARRLIEAVGSVFGGEGVALHAIVALVAVKDTEALLVVVVAEIEVVVVACGVVERRELVGLLIGEARGRYAAAIVLQIVAVGGEDEFLIGMEAVEADVLREARAGVVVK